MRFSWFGEGQWSWSPAAGRFFEPMIPPTLCGDVPGPGAFGSVGSGQVGESIGRRLDGVGRRLAALARIQTARSQAVQRLQIAPAPANLSAGPLVEGEQRALSAAIDEEIAWVPEVFRAVGLLCPPRALVHEAAPQESAVRSAHLKLWA